MALTKATNRVISGAVINVLDYGAGPSKLPSENVTAIQAAIDYGASLNGAEIFFPQGIYNVSTPITLKSNLKLTGVGGFLGSHIKGVGAGNIFEYTGSVNFLEIDGLSFSGTQCTAINGGLGYANTWHIHNCNFWADLNTGIRANLICCDIGPQNTFGYFGTTTGSLSHIISVGDPGGSGNTTNINRVYNNRMWYANGAGTSVRFDGGYHVIISGNDFESNSVPSVQIQGMYGSEVHGNWFENNPFTSVISYTNSTVGAIPNLSSVVSHNWFKPAAATTELINYTGAGAVTFMHNTGTSMAGVDISNSSDAFIGYSYGNALTGSSFGSYSTWGELTVGADGFNHTVGPKWNAGAGSPEGVIVAPVGSLYSRTDGGAATSLYVKESGASNTGWVAK
jgi:hypothetical protein